MIENESIYIKCLRKGYELGLTGITYWEMVDYLTPFGIPAKEYDFHVYFFKWFFDNFHQQIVTDSRIRELKIVFHPDWMKRENVMDGNPQLSMKTMMTFEAQEKYLNYLLLTESDKKATRANRLSWTAIITAIGTGVISICIGFGQLYYADRQDKFNQTTESTKEKSQEQDSHTLSQQRKCGTLSKFGSTKQKADTVNSKKP